VGRSRGRSLGYQRVTTGDSTGEQMSGPSSIVPYREILKDDPSLKVFMTKLAKFNKLFCDLMADGSDFTLRIEVRGHGGNLLHCRVQAEDMEHMPAPDKKKRGN
jgi:hypothetical protein